MNEALKVAHGDEAAKGMNLADNAFKNVAHLQGLPCIGFG